MEKVGGAYLEIGAVMKQFFESLETAMKKSKALQDVFNSVAKNIEVEFKAIENRAKIFGKEVDVLGEKKDVLRNKINDLINKGLKPTDERVRLLTQQYKALDKQIARNQVTVSDFTNGLVSGGKKLMMFVTAPLAALGGVSVRTAADMEMLETSFETMLGSAQDAKNLMGELKDFSASTPFQLEDLAKGSQNLLGFNVELQDIIPTMRMLGDTAKGNKNALNSVVMAYGKIQAKGKASMEEINMLIEGGQVPILKQLQKTLGKTGQEVIKMTSEGKISATVITKAFKDMTSEGGMFYKGMEDASKQTLGLWSTLKDNLVLAGGEIAETFLPQVKEAIRSVIDWVKSFRDLDDDTKSMILKVVGLAAAMGPLLIITGKLIAGYQAFVVVGGAVKAGMTGIALSTGASTGALAANKIAIIAVTVAQKGLNLAMKMNPIGAVIAGVTALTAGIMYLADSEERHIKQLEKELDLNSKKVKDISSLLNTYGKLSKIQNRNNQEQKEFEKTVIALNKLVPHATIQFSEQGQIIGINTELIIKQREATLKKMETDLQAVVVAKEAALEEVKVNLDKYNTITKKTEDRARLDEKIYGQRKGFSEEQIKRNQEESAMAVRSQRMQSDEYKEYKKAVNEATNSLMAKKNQLNLVVNEQKRLNGTLQKSVDIDKEKAKISDEVDKQNEERYKKNLQRYVNFTARWRAYAKDMGKTEVEQLREKEVDELVLLEKYQAKKAYSEEEYHKLQKAIAEKYNDEISKAEESNWKARMQKVSNAIGTIGGYVSQIGGLISQAFSNAQTAIDNALNRNLEALETERDAKLAEAGIQEEDELAKEEAELAALERRLTRADKARDKSALKAAIREKRKTVAQLKIDKDFNTQKEKLEEDAAKKKREIQKKAAQYQKAFSIFSTITNTAQAIMNVWANIKNPLAAAAMSVVVGAIGAAQVALISAQPIPMAEGGIFPARSGGHVVRVAEAGVTEPIIPLTERNLSAIGEGAMRSYISHKENPSASSQSSSAVDTSPTISGSEEQHITITGPLYLDSRYMGDYVIETVSEASFNGQLRLSGRAVT